MADYQHIEIEQRGAVRWLWLNRPEVRNAFNEMLIDEIARAFAEVEAAAEVRVVVIGARGSAFCAGADLNWMRASGLAQALAAFYADLGAHADRVTLVTLTEFGRRVAENGSRGLDHGWGNTMLLMGAGVRGGRYYGTWPGLGAANLTDGDLAVTTDYRSVLAEVLAARFNASAAQVFPGLQPEAVGVMA